MRDLLKVVLSLVLAMASGQALADLPIVLVDEARLPYDYSPSNYADAVIPNLSGENISLPERKGP